VSADELAIFPLSNVVLFPGVQTPLHVFEPRYRQLMEHALAGSRCIGMVAVPPEHTGEMAGDPPVYPIGCAGSIAWAQRLPDGRFNLVLSGTHRYRIVGEEPRPAHRLYRVVLAERLDDPFPPATRPRAADLRRRILERLRQLAQLSGPARAQSIRDDAFTGVDDAIFANSLCQGLAFEPAEKQGLLEATDIACRMERLEGLLAFRVAAAGAQGAAGSQRLH
jgi:Lon protease-like protein